MTSFARLRTLILCLLMFVSVAPLCYTQEGPYFVTYDHHMEEPGNLELEFEPTMTRPAGGNRAYSGLMEFEYGTTAWWTTELYVEGQSTVNDSTIFTGFRIENRFRVLPTEHWINPVLYLEYENTSGADKTLKEVVGFDSQADGSDPNALARHEIQHELETKLILSSDYKGWNVSENFIGEKNLGHDPWEFGYAFGVNRPVGLAASPEWCNLCSENFRTGFEFYGGLGTTDSLTLRQTSHYAAPILAWSLPNGTTLRLSPGFGLTSSAYRFVLRVGVNYEFAGFGRKVRQLFQGR